MTEVTPAEFREKYRVMMENGQVCPLFGLAKLNPDLFFETLQADKAIDAKQYRSYIQFLCRNKKSDMTPENKGKLEEVAAQFEVEAQRKLTEAEERRTLIEEEKQRKAELQNKWKAKGYGWRKVGELVKLDAPVIQKAEALKDTENATNTSVGYGSPRGP